MMQTWQESYIGGLFLRLWAVLCENWPQSGCARFLSALEEWTVRGVKDSAICRFLWRDGLVTRSWPDSLTCRFLTWLIDLPGAVCRWIYRVGKSFWDGPAVFRLVGKLGWMFVLPLGLFLMVMLMVPHGMWDNRYALMGAVALTWLLGAALRTGVGLAVLYALSGVGGLAGVHLGVNLVNALVLGLLGAPGFGLLLMVHWVLGL